MARTAALLAAAVLCWSRQTFTFAATTSSANQPIYYNSAFVEVINDTNSYNSDDRTKSDGAVIHQNQNQNQTNHSPGIANALTIDTSVTSSVSASISSKAGSPVYRANTNTNSGGASIKFRDERSRFFPTYGGDYVVDTSVSTSTSNFRSKPNRTLVDRSSLKTRNSDNNNRHLLLETPVFVKSTQNHPNHRQYSNINNEADSLLKAINDLNSAAIVVRTSSSSSSNSQSANHKPSDNTMQINDDDIPIVQILNGSDVESLRRRLEMSTEYFLVPDKPTTSTIPPSTLSTIASIITRSSITPEHPNDLLTPRTPVFRNEVWVIPVLALSAICMILIASFEVFVLCKAWRTTPSRRHLFLGQMLLLGLFACAGLGGVLAMAPTQATCAAVRFGAGVAYAVVFASLLVKCVFLISLNGGVYLPAPYQGLLLLFAVLIQVAIGAQWLLTAPPLVDVIQVEDQNVPPPRHRLLVTAEDVTSAQQILQITLCRTPYIDVLFSLCYVLFLIVFVAILAIKSRGIRDNYREATYIGLSVGCTIPIWLVWTLSGLVVGERHRDACLAFGLVITAAVIFLVMFMPKGRQLAAMGKDGVFLEDREDRFSSLSRAGSGYSPSFFHFKPIKYGTKHQPPPATITTLGADRVALCPAPPTYSRMFHCYPSPQYYYHARYLAGTVYKSGVFLRPDDGNVYTTLEPTLSSNPNVYFQRGNGMHPGMMY